MPRSWLDAENQCEQNKSLVFESWLAHGRNNLNTGAAGAENSKPDSSNTLQCDFSYEPLLIKD